MLLLIFFPPHPRLFIPEHIVNILLHNSPNNQRQGSEYEIIKCHVYIIKHSLSWIPTIKRSDELGDGE